MKILHKRGTTFLRPPPQAQQNQPLILRPPARSVEDGFEVYLTEYAPRPIEPVALNGHLQVAKKSGSHQRPQFIKAPGFAGGYLLHFSAVLEHVGSQESQARMVADCLRVARRGIFLTTPNRWFPVEFHTELPLLHWLPNDVYRPIYRAIELEFFADEANLNLMTKNDLMNIARRHPDWRFAIRFGRLLGLNSNLILCAHRTPANP